MSEILDGNRVYQVGAQGDYLTVRSKTLSDVIIPAFVTNDITLEDNDTGRVVFIPTTGAASTITLPTVKRGLNFKLVCGASSGAHTITVAGKFTGNLLLANAQTAVSGDVSLIIAASEFIAGDVIDLVCDGSRWYVSGALITATSVSAGS